MPASLLPYHDTKPVGAADFYFAINATFRFILKRFGKQGLRQYWRDLGSQYFAPVSVIWKTRGLPGVAAYWNAFFAAEPGAAAKVALRRDSVVVEVKTCPAIRHLRKHRRKIVPCFCQQCFFVNEAIAAPAGLTVRVQGGNGRCRQTFLPRNPAIPNQKISAIREAAC
ncbi:MAG: hypothetical protein PHV34_15790 [Verrucomicrobiae bacterium]|nr:hypothetical protein [Verrucomicrobiae bacterium]